MAGRLTKDPGTAPRLQRIELRRVGVRLGRHWAVRDVDFDLRKGEHWLLLGPNGAGKTVLLKLLRGDLWPTPTGRELRHYHFDDGEVQAQPIDAAVRVAYLGPERQDRYDRYESGLDVGQVVLTGFDDSDFPLVPATTAQRRRIVEVLTGVGLSGWIERPFRSLSYGQRRRVLLARVLVRRPDMLLLDEALNGLDARARQGFLRSLRRAVDPRTAWMLSSHRPADAKLGDFTHLARIAHGALQHAGPLRRTGESLRVAIGAAARSAHSFTERGPAMQSDAPLVRLERSAVYRGDRPVIGAFDWTLVSGEHWYVCGPNGSGKSTLIALLYGDLWPAHGGRLQRSWPHVSDWKQATGFVSPDLQATYAATGCTVADIVASGLHDSIGLNEQPSSRERARVRRALREWRIDELAGRQARELSYGQLRLALAARAFVRPRGLYLLDEPFDGLDAAARVRFRAKLDRAVESGATLVIASHHPEDVPRYVYKTLRMQRGRAPVAGDFSRGESRPRRR